MTKAATDTPNGVPQMQPPSPQTISTEGFAKCAHQTIEITNNKRIIACCDGTWNNSNKGTTPTNVGRLSSAIAHKCCTGMPQIVYYTRGAGTDESSKAGKYLGGIFGKGVKQEIRDTYRFICDNYNPGDEIIILGFSRGAFTARSVSGFVCTIGLLNRLGLSRFADIFDDYQDFAKWKSGQFNKEKHLKAFTLSNFKRLEQSDPKSALKGCSDEELEKALDEKKKTIYDDMVKCRGSTQERLRKMAGVYKKALEKHRMILCEKNKDEEWVPIGGKVKAVGVWDTVGSLGFPKMPSEFIPWNRNAEELRFASLDVHPSVDHAFHALALDEWRTAFKPTLWGMKGNKHTKLRQVWFPGGHSNVGGGFPDQQIATISMAWMADRLTSIGVEFSTPEMKRLCYTLQPGVKPRPWGLGKISDPDNRLITIPDRAINAFWYPIKKYDGENTKVGGRTPGKYMEDDGKKPIESPNEFIHPSARIRYLYKGLGLNDEGNWDCAALTKNGYTLEKIDESPPDEDLYPRSRIASTYETLSGAVSSVNRSLQSDIQSDNDHPLVVQEMPFKEELWPIPEKAKSHWVWTQGTGKDKKTLQEERIGMWECLFISINEEMVKREKEEAAKAAASSGQPKKPGLVRRVYDKVYNTVNDRWQSAKGRVGKMFGRTIAGRMFNRTLGKVLRPSEKPMPSDYPETYGYYDMISWQRGDPTPKPQSSGKLNQELERY
ncbi:hypothetical protein LZ32DRAFT_557910 [Colletotrichum eremochloae]|nr:hypothetical protein LZ32DRAFT_557910 [Colletotrichum eremochloae]